MGRRALVENDLAAQVFIAAKKGSGKTVLQKDIMYTYVRETPDVRFVVWDTTIEWKPVPGRVIVLSDLDVSGDEAGWIAIEKYAPCVFVCDELDKIARNAGASLPEGTSIYEIVHRGRHHQVGLLGSARRCTNVHRDVTAQADAIFFFRMREPRDLAWVGSIDGVGEEGAQRVASLKDHEWLLVRI